jgi:predicted nuclease of restriction endonuclease-like RecB superfamily
MRLALAEVKKRISRRDGALFVAPYLLKPRELLAELDAVIALYDALLEEPRAAFPEDRPAELLGDYRLARCITACLSEWYEWRAPAWPGSATAHEATALASAGILSPTHLRLALYEYVNDTTGGYLATTEREATLDTFAASLGVSRATLDTLLRLDEEHSAILTRVAGEERPSARELARRYNQRATEALLFNASQVEWTLPATLSDGAGGGLGTVLKRICFLARQMGVRYDVTFANEAPALPSPMEEGLGVRSPLLRVAEQPHPYQTNESPDRPSLTLLPRASGTPLPPAGEGLGVEAYGLPLHVTLYGPQEVMGAPNQYGERLARLCRVLLGYRRAAGTGTAALAGAGGEGLRGIARVYLYGRPASFILDERLLKLLGTTASDQDTLPDETLFDGFDSSLERTLSADFAALEQAGEARGWRLEREPEPVLADDTILVPDFVLTRGNRRVYLEIAGYWRPGYRERKARKLAALRGRVAMIVAAPESARAEFASVVDDFPFLWYTNRLSVQALLDLLERDFNDFAARVAALDGARIRREVQQRGHIPPRESMALLHVYTRNELALAVAQLESLAPTDPANPDGQQAIVWLEGIGLCSAAWREGLLARVRGWVSEAPEQRLPLTTLRALIVAAQPELHELAEPAVESLAELAGCTVVRTSIFEAEALAPGVTPDTAPMQQKPLPARQPSPRPQAQPRRGSRRKQSRAEYETPSFFPADDGN